MITILKIAPGHKPERVTIPHTLEAMQEVVGGLIQAIYPYDDPVALVCNEEGKLLGLDLNRAVRDPKTGTILDIIAGTFFLCGLSEDDFVSLSKEQIERYGNLFRCPEMFLQTESQLLIVQMEP